MVGAFAQFERDVIRERTNAGLQAARRAGKKLGRPPSISDAQWSQAKTLLSGPADMSVSAVADLLGVSRQAIYKRLRREQPDNPELQAAPPPRRRDSEAAAGA
jgi:DNA invertase Pin-like site-specific DNA recombinase